MQIKVLQGINLKNPVTTVEMTSDGNLKPDIIEMVKGFHPVFLENYTISGEKVSIQTKLPKLWREILVAVENEATGQWSSELAQKYVKETVLTKQIKSMSTIPILHAAHRMGLETIQFLVKEGMSELPINRYYSIGVGHEAQITLSVGSSKDSAVGKTVQRDKILTNMLIERLNLPIANWARITSKEEIKGLFNKFNKPVVIKPTGLVGGAGVTTKIDTYEKALKAYEYALGIVNSKERKDWQKSIMIQEQVEGEDYRILVINGKMEIATKRIPAFVTGDGIKSVKELIERENNDPRRDINNPAHILKPIQIDNPLIELLEENSISLDHIPAKDEKVQLRKEASMSRGGITEDFTDSVHPQIKYIVETLAKTIKVYVLGVDVLCKDISKPLNTDNGSIIECNTMPEAFLNFYPVIGKSHPEAGETFVRGLVNTENPTKKLVFLGGNLSKVQSLLKMQIDGFKTETIGLYSGGATYINDIEISSNHPTADSVEGLKLNGTLTTIVLHYQTREEIQENGLGFDQVDRIIIDEAFSKQNPDIISTLEGYKNLGMSYEIKVA